MARPYVPGLSFYRMSVSILVLGGLAALIAYVPEDQDSRAPWSSSWLLPLVGTMQVSRIRRISLLRTVIQADELRHANILTSFQDPAS